MVKIKEKYEEAVSMENIDVKYPWADYIDKAIIHTILNSKKSMSHYTIHQSFIRKIKFFDRLDNLCKRVPEICRWKQEKPTLQIGSKVVYEKLKNEEEKKD